MSYISFISSRSKEHEDAAQKKAEGRTKESAQVRMYNIYLERDKIESVIKELDGQNETLIEEARALLQLYPTLAFRERK
jgi:hypothetical protein